MTDEALQHTEGENMKATWKGQILAESSDTIVIEGSHYFPPDALRLGFFETASTRTVCSWKGTASYYTLVVNGERNEDAAWYYDNPKDAAKEIKGYVAFWKGVEVTA